MHRLIWLLKWALNAAIFFTLFAFALNNQADVTVHFFFGHRWQAPQVLVLLTVFAVGVVVGALGMLPWWWRTQRHSELAWPKAEIASTQALGATAIVNNNSTAVSAPAYADGI